VPCRQAAFPSRARKQAVLANFASLTAAATEISRQFHNGRTGSFVRRHYPKDMLSSQHDFYGELVSLPRRPSQHHRASLGRWHPGSSWPALSRTHPRLEIEILDPVFQAVPLGEISPALSREIAEWIDLRVASAGGIHQAELRLHPLHRTLAAAYYGSAQEESPKALDPANICRAGLAWLPAEFLSLQAARQLALLDSISDQHRAERSQNAGTQLFDYLKAETIRGFYTSKVGLKELDFKGNVFYAQSPGCE